MEEVESMATTFDKTTGVEIPALEALEPVHTRGLQRVFGVLRIALGWTFLWAFIDKAFALGFHTGRLEDGTIDFFAKDVAWLNGGSPTVGAVGFAVHGPFTDTFQTIAGYQMTAAGPQVAGWFDAVYMVSMLLIGLGLILGIGVKLAAIGGILWMAAFYLGTAIWPENNPFMDDHIVYAVVLVGIMLANAGRYYGLGKAWQRTNLVKRHPILV
jgi:thiosulfate dehydrogenase [quinone] large subunit